VTDSPAADPRAHEPDPVDAFAEGVRVRLGHPWQVERSPKGFVARLPLPQTDPAPQEGAVTDELRLEVTADAASRTYSWSSRRQRAFDRDVSRAGWGASGYSARRDVQSTQYSGERRTWSFRRTPDGLVHDPQRAEDTSGRAADLRAVAAERGWTEREGGAPAGISGGSPKRMLILAGAIIGAVVLIIVGVGVVLVMNVVQTFSH